MPIFRPRATGVVHDVIEGQVLIIRSDTGAYYSLEGTGTVVWEGILRGQSMDDIVAGAEHQFPDVPGIPADIRSLVDGLLAEGILEEGVADSSPGGVTATLWPAQWEAPSLGIFNDMKDLLLFDPIHEVGPEGWPHTAHE